MLYKTLKKFDIRNSNKKVVHVLLFFFFHQDNDIYGISEDKIPSVSISLGVISWINCCSTNAILCFPSLLFSLSSLAVLPTCTCTCTRIRTCTHPIYTLSCRKVRAYSSTGNSNENFPSNVWYRISFYLFFTLYLLHPH